MLVAEQWSKENLGNSKDFKKFLRIYLNLFALNSDSYRQSEEIYAFRIYEIWKCKDTYNVHNMQKCIGYSKYSTR